MMRTTKWIARALSGMTVAFLAAGCGGGDGGSSAGTPPSPPPATNPPATLRLSATTLAASANTAQSAPTSEFTVEVVSSAPAGTKFYVTGKFTENGIASITALDTVGDFTITFKSPASLGAGTYQDTLTLEACYDSACTQEVSDSPQTISVTYTVTDGPATLTSLSPATLLTGVASTLTINGSNFASTSVVLLNGSAVPTTFVSATQLTASIGANVIAQPGSYGVLVTPSATSDLVSNQLTLSVYAVPSITGLAPGSIAAGYPGLTLTVTGSNFPVGAVVLFGGTALPTSYVSPTQLTATVMPAQVAKAGTIPVAVEDSAAVGVPVSNPLSFTVLPLPALAPNSVDPSITTVGGPAFLLTVLGQGFAPSAVIQWNGTALQTTYGSELQLQAQVPASYIASIGTAAITVQNSTAAGGTSAPLTLKIAAAAPDAVSLQITPAHTGAINFKSLSFPNASTWSVNVGGTASYAIIADGKVVVSVAGSNSQQLIALDQATGATAWGPINVGGNSIVYDGGKVFVVGIQLRGQAPLQSYDIESGALDWSVMVDSVAGLTAANGLIYTTNSNALLGLNEGTGSVAWSATNPALLGTPAATSTGVYVSYPCVTYDFQPLSGTQIFSTSTGCGGAGGGDTVVASGLVYAAVGTGGGSIVDASSGAVVGSFTSTGPPAFNTTTGYFLQSGTLNALSSNQTVLWSFTGDGSLTTSPIVVNQAVIIGSSTGNVYALDAATGQQLWTINAGGPLYPTNYNEGLAAGDGLLIVPAGNQVVAYTLSTNP